MRPITKKLLCAAFLLPCLDLVAISVIRQISVVETDAYFEDEGSDFSVAATLFTISPSAPNFSADFSGESETEFSFTWAAPAGQMFEIFLPTGQGWEGYSAFSFGAQMSLSDTFITDAISLDTAQMSFGGLHGASFPDNVTASGLFADVDDSGISVDIEIADLVVGTHYQFESVTATFTLPASYDTAFTDRPTLGAVLLAQVQVNSLTDNPGSLMTLTAVPEPSDYALIFGLVALAAIVARRRRCPG